MPKDSNLKKLFKPAQRDLEATMVRSQTEGEKAAPFAQFDLCGYRKHEVRDGKSL